MISRSLKTWRRMRRMRRCLIMMSGPLRKSLSAWRDENNARSQKMATVRYMIRRRKHYALSLAWKKLMKQLICKKKGKLDIATGYYLRKQLGSLRHLTHLSFLEKGYDWRAKNYLKRKSQVERIRAFTEWNSQLGLLPVIKSMSGILSVTERGHNPKLPYKELERLSLPKLEILMMTVAQEVLKLEQEWQMLREKLDNLIEEKENEPAAAKVREESHLILQEESHLILQEERTDRMSELLRQLSEYKKSRGKGGVKRARQDGIGGREARVMNGSRGGIAMNMAVKLEKEYELESKRIKEEREALSKIKGSENDEGDHPSPNPNPNRCPNDRLEES